MTGLLIAFLIAHALLHLAIWVPRPKDAPFDPAHSWLIGNQRVPALLLAVLAAGLLSAGGLMLWAEAPSWKLLAAGGLGTSFLLMLVFFNRWFIPVELINLGLLLGLVWPALVRL